MKYMLLHYADVSKAPNYSPEERQAAMERWSAFQKEIETAGVLLHAEGLEPVTAATTVRFRHGKVKLSNGPFAETQEQLGGYFMIDCKDVDEAIAWAAKDPTASWGCVEVRPVATYPQE